MLNTFNGLPVHILVVHAVVVLVPIAALLAVVSALWPAARHKLGFITPAVAVVALFFVPVATSSGEWLRDHVKETALVSKHVDMGEALLPWAGLLFLGAAALWLLDVAPRRHWKIGSSLTAGWIRPALSVVIIAVAVVAVVQVFRIGDSGAKAAWDGRTTATSQNNGGG